MRAITGWCAAALLGLGALAAPAAEPPQSALQREFIAACAAMNGQPVPGTTELHIGRDSWLVLGSELDYLTLGRFWGPDARRTNPDLAPANADPLAAVLDFDRQLKQRGIELIFMPVPTRIEVFPEAVLGKDKLPPGVPPRLFSAELEFYRLLRSRGVTVVDLTPVFLAKRRGEHGAVFVPSESHWTGYGAVVGAREAAKVIRSRPWYRKMPEHELSATWSSREHDGHILKSLREATGDATRKPDLMWLRQIQEKSGLGHKTLGIDQPDSPVVVIGDSNILWWTGQGAGLSQEIAFELGFPVDTIISSAGGATNSRINLARRAHAEPGYLERKKAVVWSFTTRGFVRTGDGWALIPLEAAPPAAGTKGDG